MSDELERIKSAIDYAEQRYIAIDDFTIGKVVDINDVRWLVAEVERLRETNERLEQKFWGAQEYILDLKREIEDLTDDIDTRR